MYKYICPECGAHLDPGETCDCIAERENRSKEIEAMLEELLEEEKGGQLRIAV